MEKQKAKGKYGDHNLRLRDRMIRTIPFEFVSPVNFDDCLSQLSQLNGKSKSLGYRVEISPIITDVYGGWNCEFLVRTSGYSVLVAVGTLRTYADETGTHVKGFTGMNWFDPVIFILLVMLAIAYIAGVDARSTLTLRCCLGGFLLFALFFGSLMEFRMRYDFVYFIRNLLQARPSYL
jgi:hypothetical protein